MAACGSVAQQLRARAVPLPLEGFSPPRAGTGACCSALCPALPTSFASLRLKLVGGGTTRTTTTAQLNVALKRIACDILHAENRMRYPPRSVIVGGALIAARKLLSSAMLGFHTRPLQEPADCWKTINLSIMKHTYAMKRCADAIQRAIIALSRHSG